MCVCVCHHTVHICKSMHLTLLPLLYCFKEQGRWRQMEGFKKALYMILMVSLNDTNFFFKLRVHENEIKRAPSLENSHEQSSTEHSREKHKHEPFSSLLYAHALFALRTPSTRLHTFWFMDISCVRLFRLITLHGVRRFREGTGLLNFLFNKLSVHLQSSQCFVLHVGTLIMLPWKCGAILSLVSSIELRFILHE